MGKLRRTDRSCAQSEINVGVSIQYGVLGWFFFLNFIYKINYMQRLFSGLLFFIASYKSSSVISINDVY